LSIFDLVYGLKGHAAVILRLDGAKEMVFPTQPSPLKVPAFSFLLCIEGIAPVVEAQIAKAPALKRTDRDGLHRYELKERLPIEGLHPTLIADGSTLYLASSPEFFDECRERKTGLAQDVEFQRALARIGAEGNGLTFISPKLLGQIRRIETLNPDLPAEAKSVFALIMGSLIDIEQPLITVRTNLPEGILYRSHLNRSLKRDVAVAAMYNPITLGLMAAMAIPAFQKIRYAAQEKVVFVNLYKLSTAADQFFQETGAKAANFADLVGVDSSLAAIKSAAGEDYRQLRFIQGVPLRLTLPDGRVVQYPIDPQISFRIQRSP
jgi:type IV pilus assembly protein PilA